MKNKIFATLLALTLALSLTACGSKSDVTLPRPTPPMTRRPSSLRNLRRPSL